MKRKPSSPNSVWIARYESRSHTFEAVDATAEDAVATLCEGMRRHARQVGIAVEGWWTPEDIIIRRMMFGVPHRDGEGLFPTGGVA